MLNKLGSSGLLINPLGFGGIPIQRISFNEAKKVIDKAKNLGINFIDSAQGYSDSEDKIGHAINESKNHWILASKSPAKDSKGMEEALTQSLIKLRRDHIDIYQLHLVSSMEDLNTILGPKGAMETLFKFKEKGYINYIGITGHKPSVLKQALDIFPFDSVQVPFNPLETYSKDLLCYAKSKGVGTIVMKPLAGGALTCPTACIKYILNQEFVEVVIPGMESIQQLEENFKASQNLSLSLKEENLIQKDIDELQSNFCRRCEYCQPCPEGIKIPTVFILHGYVKRYGLLDWAKPRYHGLPIHADKCTQCGVCESKCPYELPIRKMLQTAHQDF